MKDIKKNINKILTDTETKIIIEYKSPYVTTVEIPLPGSDRAYYIIYNDQQDEIPLIGYIGATPPDTLVIDSLATITYVFHKLPDDVNVFNLKDGKREIEPINAHRDASFYGIRLIK